MKKIYLKNKTLIDKNDGDIIKINCFYTSSNRFYIIWENQTELINKFKNKKSLLEYYKNFDYEELQRLNNNYHFTLKNTFRRL